MVGKQERVCVTGAGGYLASWIVKLLLSNGYSVHGTVRDPCDEKKNSHLKKLENSSENLQLFKADLLDYEGLCAAISGCTGVFHVACPVPAARQPNPEVDMIQPALDGTRNVLNACLKAKVRRVVVVSSVSAVMVKSNWPKDQEMDEECWSDVEFCKEVQNYYWLAKTMAEREAWDYSKKKKLEIITVCPSVIIGPKLQATVNASSLFLLRLLTDGPEEVQNAASLIVDVRDVAEALLLVYEKPEAQGRYICTSYRIRMSALAEKIRNMYPNYNGTRNIIEAKLEPYPISSKKLQDLGWKYRALEETIVDSVKEYQESGILGEN